MYVYHWYMPIIGDGGGGLGWTVGDTFEWNFEEKSVVLSEKGDCSLKSIKPEIQLL